MRQQYQFRIGETAKIARYGKTRPCVILSINPRDQNALVAIGSTTTKEKRCVTVVGGSTEARMMSLDQTTHFYPDRTITVPLANLIRSHNRSTCPENVFRLLRTMIGSNPRYIGGYRGHFGNYEPDPEVARQHKQVD